MMEKSAIRILIPDDGGRGREKRVLLLKGDKLR